MRPAAMMIGPQGADCVGLDLAAIGGEGLTVRQPNASVGSGSCRKQSPVPGVCFIGLRSFSSLAALCPNKGHGLCRRGRHRAKYTSGPRTSAVPAWHFLKIFAYRFVPYGTPHADTPTRRHAPQGPPMSQVSAYIRSWSMKTGSIRQCRSRIVSTPLLNRCRRQSLENGRSTVPRLLKQASCPVSVRKIPQPGSRL